MSVSTLSRRSLSAAVLSGYAFMAANLTVQVLLVPLYLRTLGTEDFGVLMLTLGMVNFAAVGIGWLSGSLQRVLGEYAGRGDRAGFFRALKIGRAFYVGYAALAGLTAVTIVWLKTDGDPSRSMLKIAALAALYFIIQYDLAIERLAHTAEGRQATANLLQLLALILFAAPLPFVLPAGGGLAAVFLSLIASVFVARLMSAACWRGRRAFRESRTDGDLIRRLTGRLAGGYFVYGLFLLAMQADVLLVGWLGGAEAAASFVLIWKIAEVAIQIVWRIPEALSPLLIHMDARGEREQLRSVYARSGRGLSLLALAAGGAYAAIGPWLSEAWLGAAYASSDRLGFLLAGGAIFWLASARLPSIYAYSLARLVPLNRLAGAELAAKFVLTVVLFPKLSYLAPLAAINLTHLFGAAYAYRRLGRSLTAAGAAP